MLKLNCFLILAVAIGVNCQTDPPSTPTGTSGMPTTTPTTTKQPKQVITVTNGETEGQWGPLESCPPGSRAVSYQTRNELSTPRFDDTALNTIILFCNDELITNFTSTPGFSGDFYRVQNCPFGGYMTSFQLRVAAAGTYKDNTAANDIRFRCSSGDEINAIANNDGEWGEYSDVCENGICGMETLLLPYDGGIGHYDNTALNDVRFTCC